MATSPLLPTETSHTQRSLAALSYAWILSVPVLVFGQDDPFIGPHARQGAILFVLSIIAWFIPYAGYVLEILLGTIMVMGYMRAAQGQPFVLPLTTGAISTALSKMGKEWSQLRNKPTVHENGATPASETKLEPDLEHDNQLAACSYLWIASVVVADNNHGSERILFHARQGVVIFLLFIISTLLGTIGTYASILLLVASVAGFLSALSGQATRLPIIYQISLHLPSLDATWAMVRTKLSALRSAPGERDEGASQDPTEEYEPTPDKRERTLAMLGYVFLGPIFLLSTNASSFVSFHARQGLLLNATLLGLYALYPTAYSGLVILLTLTVLGASRSHRGIRSPLPIVAEVVDGIAKLFTLTKNHASLSHLPINPQGSTQDTQSIHDG